MDKNIVSSFDNLPLILTVNHLSDIMGISRVGAYALTKRHGFPVIRVGRRITIPRASFVEWLRSEAGKENDSGE